MPRDQKFAWLPNAEKTLEGSHSLFSLFCYYVLRFQECLECQFGTESHFLFLYLSFFFFNIAIEDCFQETLEAMVSLGVDTDRRAQIFRVSSATRLFYSQQQNFWHPSLLHIRIALRYILSFNVCRHRRVCVFFFFNVFLRSAIFFFKITGTSAINIC